MKVQNVMAGRPAACLAGPVATIPQPVRDFLPVKLLGLSAVFAKVLVSACDVRTVLATVLVELERGDADRLGHYNGIGAVRLVQNKRKTLRPNSPMWTRTTNLAVGLNRFAVVAAVRFPSSKHPTHSIGTTP